MLKDGATCPGCGLPNYEGLCPVCRGDEEAYREELEPYFGSSDGWLNERTELMGEVRAANPDSPFNR